MVTVGKLQWMCLANIRAIGGNEAWFRNRSARNYIGPGYFPCRPLLPNVCLAVGIDTSQLFGNNRTGGILVRVVRPDTTKPREDRLKDIAAQFRVQCAARFSDAISSYDFMRGFDVGKIREYFSNNIFDVANIYYPEPEGGFVADSNFHTCISIRFLSPIGHTSRIRLIGGDYHTLHSFSLMCGIVHWLTIHALMAM